MGNVLQGGARGATAFRYPPPAGETFFSSEFFIGPDRYPAMDPEAFLFGDMADLYFLSKTPAQTTQAPPAMKHINTLRSLLNLQKESLRLVRHARQEERLSRHHLEFVFDADVPCEISVHVNAREVVDRAGHGVRFQAAHSILPVPCPAGANQVFAYPEIYIDLADYPQGLPYAPGDDVIPVVVLLAADRATANPMFQESDADDAVQGTGFHALATFASLELDGTDGSLTLRPLVQKLYANGAAYVLREIYGLEHKPAGQSTDADSDGDCLVCMSEPRDTLVLPCRHLCLCRGCAEVLRYQANRCPICRAAFHSLLQLRVAMEARGDAGEAPDEADLPAGFRSVAIIEALNPRAGEGEAVAAEPVVPLSPRSEADMMADGVHDLVMMADDGAEYHEPTFVLPGTPVSARQESPAPRPTGSTTTLEAVDLGHNETY